MDGKRVYQEVCYSRGLPCSAPNAKPSIRATFTAAPLAMRPSSNVSLSHTAMPRVRKFPAMYFSKNWEFSLCSPLCFWRQCLFL